MNTLTAHQKRQIRLGEMYGMGAVRAAKIAGCYPPPTFVPKFSVVTGHDFGRSIRWARQQENPLSRVLVRVRLLHSIQSRINLLNLNKNSPAK